MPDAEFAIDCTELCDRDLKEKYKLTYSSYIAMMRRRNKGFVISDEIAEFRRFLMEIGPRPDSAFTLDRNDPKDLEYAPGKVAWRSKLDQTRNRTTTRKLTDSDGATRTVAEWASILGVSIYTLHGRLAKGWSDVEVLYGRGRNPVCANPFDGLPWPEGREIEFESLYQRAVSSGDRSSRSSFLLTVATRKVRQLVDQVVSDVPPMDDLSPEHAALLRRADYWQNEMARAQALVRADHQRSTAARRAFATRSGGIGPAREAALFDLVTGAQDAPKEIASE